MTRYVRRLVAFACLVLSALWLAPSVAAAAGYKIVGPLRGMNRPDLPCCVPFAVFGPPSISGDYVVFTSRNGPPDAVWSYRISKKRLRKLVSVGDRVPGGRGRFSSIGDPNLEYQALVGGSTVTIFGRDADNAVGLYAVPAGGGDLTLIANTRTRIPGGRRIFRDLRSASSNGETVVFLGVGPEGATGVFRAAVDGTGLRTVIDASETTLDARTRSGPSPDYFAIFYRPTIGASLAQFSASGLFDPVTGPNAVFRRQGGFQDIADNLTRLPGGSNRLHVRTGATSAAPETSHVAFAADQPDSGFAGLFRAKNSDDALLFVSTRTRVPGAPARFAGFLGFGYDASGLAFTATYVRSGGETDRSVYFVAAPGEAPVAVARGVNYVLPTVGDRSIDDGRIVFCENTICGDTFFLATPRP